MREGRSVYPIVIVTEGASGRLSIRLLRARPAISRAHIGNLLSHPLKALHSVGVSSNQ